MDFDKDRIQKLRDRLKKCYRFTYKNDTERLGYLSSELKSEANPFIQVMSTDLSERFSSVNEKGEIKQSGFSKYTVRDIFFNKNRINYDTDAIPKLELYCSEIESKIKEEKEDLIVDEPESIEDGNSKLSFEQKLRKYQNIIAVITLFLITSFLLFYYFKNKEIELIEQNIETADNYYNSQQYEKAIKEYKSIVKSFPKSDLDSYHPILLTQIGGALQLNNIKLSSNQANESIIYYNKAIAESNRGTDLYNVNCIGLFKAYHLLYLSTKDEKYVEYIKYYSSEIESNNIVIQGLKYFMLAEYWSIKKNNKNSITFFDNALMIFNKENNPAAYFSITERKAESMMLDFHDSKSSIILKDATEIYSELYNEAASKFIKTKGEYGLGHCLYHEYLEDNSFGKLSDAESYIKNTLNTFTIENFPDLFAQSHQMLFKMNMEMYSHKKDSISLKKAITNIDESLKFYTTTNYPDHYYESLSGLSECLFYLNEISFNRERCIKNLSVIRESLTYFTYESDTDYFLMLSSMLAINYSKLAKKDNSKHWFEKKEETLRLKPSLLFKDTTDINRIRSLGEKYSKLNHEHYLMTNENESKMWANIYYDLYINKKDSVQNVLKMLHSFYYDSKP